MQNVSNLGENARFLQKKNNRIHPMHMEWEQKIIQLKMITKMNKVKIIIMEKKIIRMIAKEAPKIEI